MPHCIVEYSQNLEQEVPPVELLEAVKAGCIASTLFTVEDIKLRSVPYKSFLTAGQEDAFVHVILRLLSGRTLEQRKQLSELVLASLGEFALKDVSLSVEVCEMERDTYSKKVVLSQKEE